MEIFDFNIHLPSIQHEDVNVVIQQDLNLNIAGIQDGFRLHQPIIQKCSGVNFLLFNTKLFSEDVSPFFTTVETAIKEVKYTALIDFRSKDVFKYIDNIKQCGVHAIMFNSYLQQIAESDFEEVVNVCKYAAEKQLIICIDGSYGTSKMYEYDNMKLICLVADFVKSVPIVIVHSGGYRLIEAMLLAADKKNVWLDTSFSLPYYMGSSIETDFAFVIKKMDFRRIVFGSDHPYIHFDDAVKQHINFFSKFNLTSAQIENVMALNAKELFNVG